MLLAEAAALWLLAGGAAVGFLIATGLVRPARRSSAPGPALPPAETSRIVSAPDRVSNEPPPPAVLPAVGLDIHNLCAALANWLTDADEHTDLWPAFDQLVRELLTTHLGAVRIRCYHVRTGCSTLQPLNATGTAAGGQVALASTAAGPPAREGVLGHVATTGQEYVTTDVGHGPLVDDLAARGEGDWDWVWPVRKQKLTIGLIAAAHLRDPALLNGEGRTTLGRLLALAWHRVADLEQLRVLKRTDPPSGVLTRNDFFTLAGHALAESYRGNEPVVVAVFAVEGLRRLDDSRHWRERDALIEQLGPLIARRVRSDDLVGRFADDRFVVLLRRLDSGLGRLIAEKVWSTAHERVRQCPAAAEHVRVRVGLAGSGLEQPGLETLLERALATVDLARREGIALKSDLEGPGPARPAEANPPPENRNPEE
jgi:GGDEF domain-containing protein